MTVPEAVCGDRIATEDLRAMQLALLAAFRQRCDDLGLDWFVTGGTLLGAIRHQGYIPWDDDLDVMMRREDFERFCAAGGFAGLTIASQHGDRTYPFPYAKLYLPGTRVVEHYDPMPSYGVHIDVFPVDGWPSMPLRRRALWLAVMVIRVVLGVRLVRPRSMDGAFRRVVLHAGRLALRPVDPAALGRSLTRLVRRQRVDDRCGIVVWGRAETFPASAMASSVMVPFEGTVVPAPTGWDDCLTSFYGDYMVLPPVDQRVGHAKSISFRIST